MGLFQEMFLVRCCYDGTGYTMVKHGGTIRCSGGIWNRRHVRGMYGRVYEGWDYDLSHYRLQCVSSILIGIGLDCRRHTMLPLLVTCPCSHQRTAESFVHAYVPSPLPHLNNLRHIKHAHHLPWCGQEVPTQMTLSTTGCRP
jgi:hypothetical protein